MSKAKISPLAPEALQEANFEQPLQQEVVSMSPVVLQENNGENVFFPAQKGHSEWKPYENAWTETPFLSFMRKPVSKWVEIRQGLVKNPIFGYRLPFPCIQSLNRSFTLGECIALLVWLAVTLWVAVSAIMMPWSRRISGVAAAASAAVTFGLCVRNSLFTFLFGIPFERQLFWHKLWGFSTGVFAWIHAYICLKKYIDPFHKGNFSGILLIAAVTLLVLFSEWHIRRYLWNLFHFSHIFFFVLAGAFGIYHNIEVGAGQGVFFGLAAWGTDLILRFLYLTWLRNPHQCTATRLPAGVVRLTFPKEKFHYSAGQYVFLMIPKINIFEWHPFSFSSSPHHNEVSIHIKALGNWTKKLVEVIPEGSDGMDLKVYMDGPYGAPEVDMDSKKYKLFLLISGGIGITPMQSICNQLVHEHEDQGRPMKKVVFVWSCANKFMMASTHEEDRAWCRGAMDNFQTNLPLCFQQPETMRRLTVDQSFLRREKTFKRVPMSKESLKRARYPKKPLVDILHTEFYLTREDEEAFNEGEISRELRPYARFGRPNYMELFLTMRCFAIQQRERRVAVCVCGPSAMVHEVRALASSFSQDGVTFDFHAEVFEF